MADFWDRAARADAEFYVDDRGLRGEEFWRGGEDIVRLFEEHLEFEVRGDALVEIGCGIGRITRVLAGRADSVVALDVSAEMLERAQAENPQLGNVRWIHGDGTSLAGVEDEGADGVFSHVVFQHIPDPAITLGYVREMGRVLRPGGWAAFQVSNDPKIHRRRWWRRSSARDRAWLGSAVDLGELRSVAESAGLEVARVVGEGTQFCLALLRRR